MACTKAIGINVAVITMWVLVFIGTMVGMGAAMHKVTMKISTVTITGNVFWDRMEVSSVGGSETLKFKDIPPSDCYYDLIFRAGQAFVAMMALAFIFYLIAGILLIIRVLNKENAIPACGPHVLNGELAMHIMGTFWYWLGMCIWGATVYRKTEDAVTRLTGMAGSFSTMATGYGFIIFCAILALVTLILIIVIRSDESLRYLVQPAGLPFNNMAGVGAGGLPPGLAGGAPALPPQAAAYGVPGYPAQYGVPPQANYGVPPPAQPAAF